MTIQESARIDTSKVPAHIPPELVVPFDLLRISGAKQCPFQTMNSLRGKGSVLYTPSHFSSADGAWVLTRGEDIRYVLQTPGLFSSKGVSGFSKLLGEDWDMIPLELDPPDHTKFRALLNPLLAPARIAQMQDGIRASCIELINNVVDQGGCDFVQAFARQFPVRIFMQLMGLPLQDLDRILLWEDTLLHAADQSARVEAAATIRDYLLDLIAARRKSPTGDLTSFATHATIAGVGLTDDEMLGICYLLFVGGLDTVASSLGFYFKYLAEHPEQQQKLREDPSLIPDAIEEMLRAYSVVMVSRFVTEDTEVAGVSMKKGDCIAMYSMFASLDPEDFDHPQEMDFSRSPNRHIAFASGPHRCIGSHLARRELVIAIEEWMRLVPPFEIADDDSVRMHGGVVFGVDALPLKWT
ncbi:MULTISPECIES: cytochrome P450 [unclassified Pseudomonas]|uniref:cytochrome P450 n=1 Tax=unclassified Pseudomonas TaxID=196821 RepID=UPI0039B73793